MKMVDCIGKAAMYEQAAEECAELMHALLKAARILRGENPTPVAQWQAEADITEEFTDLIQCAGELELTVDQEQLEEKAERFKQRWRRWGKAHGNAGRKL